MSILTWLKTLTLLPALIIAAVLVVIAMVLFRRGILPTLLWVAAIVLVGFAVYNHIRAGSGG